MTMHKRKPRTHVHHDMPAIGVCLWLLGCVRLHADGSSFGYVFRWWHPVTWVLFIVMVVPCAVFGEKLLDVMRVRLKPFGATTTTSCSGSRPGPAWTPSSRSTSN